MFYTLLRSKFTNTTEKYRRKMDFVEENYFLVRRKVRQKSDERSLEILLTTLLIYSLNYLRSINLHFVIESVYP